MKLADLHWWQEWHRHIVNELARTRERILVLEERDKVELEKFENRINEQRKNKNTNGK